MNRKSCCILTLALLMAACVVGCVAPGMVGALQGYQSTTYSLAPKGTPPLSRTLKLVGQDGQFLGYINVSPDNPKSFLNDYGIYGSKYSATSIWNPYSQYGSKYSHLSAFNSDTTQPPMIYIGQVFIAYLTMNKYLSPAITPLALLQLLSGR